MRARLSFVSDSDRAERLAAVLASFGIAVDVTHGEVRSIIGQAGAELWVPDAELELARARLADIWDATILLSLSEPSTCARCAYPLAVPTARGRCAECGHPFFVLNPEPADWICPTCGESVPSSFDRCWNCSPSPGSAADPPSRWPSVATPRIDPQGVFGVVVALAPWVLVLWLTPHLSRSEFLAASGLSVALSLATVRFLGGRSVGPSGSGKAT